jgi:two-component system sensor histidine kinase/response regulator
MNTILLVDDDDVLRSNYKLALEQSGYRVIEASSGNAGYKLAQSHLPDLILSDIGMPDGDGQSVLQRIRQDPSLNRSQVVLITGDLNGMSPRKGMEAGADDFLLKPVNLETLVNCVRARLVRAAIHWRVEDGMLSQLRSSLDTIPDAFLTPLAGIVGLTEVLVSTNTVSSVEVTQEIGREIRSSALRLHRTLKNYLLILNLENRSGDALGTPVGILPYLIIKENILSAVREVNQRMNREKDIQIQMEECAIFAGATDLHLIASELLGNACEFSRPGTPITLKLDRTGILTVSDAGRGMTPEEIAQINKAARIDLRNLEQRPFGTGLFLVQKVAARCDAKISIKSQTSEGTHVSVAFPVKSCDL